MDHKEQNKSEVAKREDNILQFWKENKIFEKILKKESPNGNFVFYDGPPFATGEPHYGHILAGTIKDAVPRYETMKGKKVLRKWGWDCHGLPIENLIEKELGLKSKKDIILYGIEKFNKKAKDSVFKYAHIWKDVIPRFGRFVDMENDYRTMDKSYTESVWWSFKTLYDKGLIYKSFKSMHLCPRCETTLSNFEVNQGYKDITDISVYVKFELEDEPNTYLLVWTTTPWTLPGNTALAINKDMEYVEVKGEVDGNKYIIAKSRVENVFKENYEILREVSTKEILGKKYKPLFNYYSSEAKLENKENSWKIYAGDFVTDTDGTGIVHIAPAFGEDDYNLLKQYSLPFIQHVSSDGKMKSEVIDFAGLFVKPKNEEGEKDAHQKTDIEIIKYLAKNNLLFAKEKIVHSYPHCWRCDTPLLNYATSSWFVKVTDLKERMLELNKKIKWLPEEIGQNRFGDWIEGARDWAISRSRFWGAPLPVWQKKDGSLFVVGSVEEIKQKIKKRNNYFFVRHGESEANANGDIIMTKENGKCSLTENGRKEVVDASKILKDKNIDIIFSSPFLRTKETAEIIKENIGFNNEIIFDKRLSEIEAGQFDGLTWEKYIRENFPTPRERFEKKISGVENWDDVRKRMADFMYDIDSRYEGKNILVVSHGAPLHLTALFSKGFSVREMETANYYEDAFYNAEVREIDFRKLPINENFEIDLHRPFIDDLEVFDENGEKMERISDVFDTWYDSGSMPFASVHYPFENKDLFEKNDSSLFPADFIAEGLDQTRGWFYTLLVLSTGLFDKSPYESVIVNGLVLAEDGRKMSKKLKNYPDPMDVLNKYGADSVRYVLLSTPLVKAEDFNFSEKLVDEVYKKIVSKIENILSLYEMYNFDFKDSPKEIFLDSWIINKLVDLEKVISSSMDKYELDKATRPIMDFMEDLSNWYIRVSRERFKSDSLEEKKEVLFYTRYVLNEFSKIIAPFMPFLAENIYKRTIPKKESVHLEDWPKYNREVDEEINSSMIFCMDFVTNILIERENKKIKIKQPLNKIKIGNSVQVPKYWQEAVSIIKKEGNVKDVILDNNISLFELDTEITEDLKEEGFIREFIRAIQDVRKKQNLIPSQDIIIYLKTENKDFFQKYKSEIFKPTGAKDLLFENKEFSNNFSLGEENISFDIKLL